MLLVAFLIQECLNSCTLHTSQQKSFIHIRVFCRADSLLLICLCVVSYVASIASLSLRIFCACVCPILIFFRNLLIPGASMILHVINNFNFLRETHTVSLPLSSLLVSVIFYDLTRTTRHTQHGRFNTTLLQQCTLGTNTICTIGYLIYYTASPEK